MSKIKPLHKHLLSLLLLLCSTVLFAAPKQAPTEKFRLIHADKLFMNKMEAEQILELSGNVHFFYGSTEFRSSRALIFDAKKIARLYGNVIVSNDSLTLNADTLAYYRIPELLNMGGRVLATHKNKQGEYRWIKSNYASYDKKNNLLTTWGKVSAFDRKENAYAHCGYARWDRRTGYALLLEEPNLQAGTTDSLFIKSDKMEFFDQERKMIATFNVEVYSRDYSANSDFLIYFMEEDKAVFTGQPSFNSDFAIANAEEFHLFFTDRKLNRAELIDSCQVLFSEEKKDEKTNTVHADFISMLFVDDQIRKFTAEGNVDYYFKQIATEKRDYFANSATGVYLQAIVNEDSKLTSMQMKTNIKGKYVFKNDS
ncbi:MAG: OstA-like protein [Candidatus Cloacimonetes bacterium]|nr:OstA-like protein [Candidatus Cloacimonadota bacterium]